MTKSTHQGSVTPAMLVITGSFIIIIYGLLFLLTMQVSFSHRQVAREQALNIAEAGINYYRWQLAHDPTNYTNLTQTYKDPQGSEIGSYQLEITPPENGSTIVTVRSIGTTTNYPNLKRTITAQYGSTSFSNYVFLNNGSVWYGPGAVINGDIHSNNGIRMDGINTGRVTSAKDEYQCGSETGCHPPTKKPGVWGSGQDQALWEFPVTPVDFDSIAFDFSTMRDSAQTNGLYLPSSGHAGYHIVLNNNTFDVYTVLNTGYYYGYSVPGEGLGKNGQGGCRKRYQIIDSESHQGTYNVTDTTIVFAEDDLWVEGVLDGKMSIVAAGFPLTSQNMNIWIPNNLTYTNPNNINSLGLIAQNDIYFTRNVPNNFEINAALIAQKGRVIRHGYFWWCEGTTNAVRNSLTINGSISSYSKSYWNYGDPLESGFTTRNINYDNNLLYTPPPYFPTTDNFTLISWKEE